MASTLRFSEVEEDKIAIIIDSAVPANTKRQTNWRVSVCNGKLSKKNVFFANFLCFICRCLIFNFDGSAALSVLCGWFFLVNVEGIYIRL